MGKQEINYVNSSDVCFEDLTPVMQQYLEIKRQNPDIILLYRLGDFYEMFFEDAVLASRELEIALTGREAGSKVGRIPMCGIPAKAAAGYIEKFVKKNIKTAICDQLEEAGQGQKLVKRGVTRVITAGTLTESDFLEQNSNNYICAVFKAGTAAENSAADYGFAYADVSTGELKVTKAPLDLVLAELTRLSPTEVIGPDIQEKLQPFQIVPETRLDLPDEIKQNYNCSKVPAKVFGESFALNNLKSLFANLDAFGFEGCKPGFYAAGALLAYVWETLKENVPKFERIDCYELSEYMIIDKSTRRNLELTETLREKSKYGSLLWAIDNTKTNMGARLLKNRICQPLKTAAAILQQQEYVSELVRETAVRNALAGLLDKIYDIGRIATRISSTSANPKDFLGLKLSLNVLPELFAAADELVNNPLAQICGYKDEMIDYTQMIERTIRDDAPHTIKEGGIIKPEANGELDYYRELLENGEGYLKKLEAGESESTGITNLKVGYNRVFGYFIEVTNSQLSKVPPHYVRKQTLSGAERFITDELKKHEDDVLSARFRSTELEYKLFCDFREYSKEYVTKIRQIADAVANLDVYVSLAQTAAQNNYCCPEIDDSCDFVIKNGRHPVLEKILPLGEYVPNDLTFGSYDTGPASFMILTGPNMAGKSTYMRQNALIALLAQIGSWVPADYAKIGAVDKIFTRVGASDDLTLGQSTFMVEMVETACILNSATDKSFVLLDEIGRGTSTYDGVSIAWAVAEHIATKIGARCIFATHYHELNIMTNTYPQIKNYRITVNETDGKIEFLRKIVPGGTSKSYGIQVAKMAGLPAEVVKRSQELMSKIQRDFEAKGVGKSVKPVTDPHVQKPQLNLFLPQ